jgi:hypothetical protein
MRQACVLKRDYGWLFQPNYCFAESGQARQEILWSTVALKQQYDRCRSVLRRGDGLVRYSYVLGGAFREDAIPALKNLASQHCPLLFFHARPLTLFTIDVQPSARRT